MSEIPSDIAGSALQAGVQARRIAEAAGSERAGAAQRAQKGVRAVDDAAATVETSDDDAAVFADSEGIGSQGRENEDDNHPADDLVDDGAEDNPEDANGPPRLDIEA